GAPARLAFGAEGAATRSLPQGGDARAAIAQAGLAAGTTSYLLWTDRTTGAWGSWGMAGTTYQGDWTALYAEPVATAWQVVASADFTGDGQADLVWQNGVTGDVGIWPMTGATWSGQHLALGAVPTQWQVAAAADFSGDGKADLVWQNVQTGERGLWVMNGTAFTGEYRLLYPELVPTAWEIAGAADMNGDGKADLVWQHAQTGERGAWLMNGSTYASFASLYSSPVPTAWDIAAVADMTGDGKADLVWQNTATGERGLWVMNGTTWTGEYRLLYQGNVDTRWHIAAVLPVAAVPCTAPAIGIGSTVNGTLVGTDCHEVGFTYDPYTLDLRAAGGTTAFRATIQSAALPRYLRLVRGDTSFGSFVRSIAGDAVVQWFVEPGDYRLRVSIPDSAAPKSYTLLTQPLSDIGCRSNAAAGSVNLGAQKLESGDCTFNSRFEDRVLIIIRPGQQLVARMNASAGAGLAIRDPAATPGVILTGTSSTTAGEIVASYTSSEEGFLQVIFSSQAQNVSLDYTASLTLQQPGAALVATPASKPVGQMATFTYARGGLTQETYPGSLGGAAVNFARVNDTTLAVVVPDVPVGARTAVASIGTVVATGTLQVEAGLAIADPPQAIRASLESATASLVNRPRPPAYGGNWAADSAWFGAALANVEAEIANLTPAEQLEVARYLASTPLPAPSPGVAALVAGGTPEDIACANEYIGWNTTVGKVETQVSAASSFLGKVARQLVIYYNAALAYHMAVISYGGFAHMCTLERDILGDVIEQPQGTSIVATADRWTFDFDVDAATEPFVNRMRGARTRLIAAGSLIQRVISGTPAFFAAARAKVKTAVPIDPARITLETTQVLDDAGKAVQLQLEWRETDVVVKAVSSVNAKITRPLTFKVSRPDFADQRKVINVPIQPNCVENGVTYPTCVDRIEVTPGSVTMLPNRSVQLTVKLYDKAGALLENRPFSWRNPDGNVVSVSGSGLVTSQAKGRVTLTVSAGDEAARRTKDVVVNVIDQPQAIDLGTLGGAYAQANDVNDAGQVVGQAQLADGSHHAFLWENGVMKDLGAPAGKTTNANGINKWGVVVGTVSGSGGAIEAPFVYKDGQLTVLTGLAGVSWANDIADDGTVIGVWQDPASGYRNRAFTYKDGVYTVLEVPAGSYGASAYRITPDGKYITGKYWDATRNNEQLALWVNGAFTWAPVPSGTTQGGGWWVNASGVVVGYNQANGVYQGIITSANGFQVTSDLSLVTTIDDAGQVSGRCGSMACVG
ncbi:MAG TPA: FG-GAP-like repeat-containing protein, partial [Gemmatimonadaceae bacterium]